MRLFLGRYRSGAARVLVCGLAGGLGELLSVWRSKQRVKGRAAICLGLKLVVDEGVRVEGEGMGGW